MPASNARRVFDAGRHRLLRSARRGRHRCPPRLMHPPPIQTLEQRLQLRRAQPHHPVVYRRPTEMAIFQALSDKHDAAAVPEDQLHPCTARHSAYRSQFVVVVYPWHPLHGQRVRVYGRQGRAGRQILYIEVRPGLSREIPAWMCDAAVCAAITSGSPRIPVDVLTELRAFSTPVRPGVP